MIERKNIIKLLGDKSNVYHSAVLTTYSFDPIFFESVYLPVLRKLGITNIVVLMDANMYDRLLADTNYQCHKVTQSNYTLLRQESTHSGVFHPKMVLLFGEEEGVLVSGSGNLTYSGLSNNEEVWSAFHIMGSKSIHYPLFYKAWHYLTHITNSVSPLVQRQINRMEEQCPWLREESNEDYVLLHSGEECRLLYNSANSTILNSVYATIEKKEIDEITVIAPFYDPEGHALKELQRHLAPQSIRCVLDLKRQSAPYSLLQDNTSISYYKFDSSNPLHAKIIEIQGKNETWILCGSANAGNMALGTNTSIFNDEVCILLYSEKRRNYIKDLDIHFSLITPEEKKSIVRPKQEKVEMSSLLVRLVACEEKENKLFLQFSKSGIKGNLTLLDNAQHVLFCSDITTDKNISIDVKNADISAMHIAVLKKDDIEISNRILIVREINVERGNPDPKRRKLSSLLDDADLFENLNHILGYIEFDDTEKKAKATKSIKTATNDDTEDNAVVTSDRFTELKDSTLNISLHSGVRILDYLKQILFQKEDVQTDDELLDMDEGGGGKKEYIAEKETDKIQPYMNDASKMRVDVVNFLKKMQNYLIAKTKDKSIYGDVIPDVNRPKLMAIPGLNSASSLAVASLAVVCMMNKYGSHVIKTNEVKELLIKNAGIFLSLYSNKLPANDSSRNHKTLELLKDATVNLLTALCFFPFSKGEPFMPQLVLNCLEMGKRRNELSGIMPLFEEQLQKLHSGSLNDKTINTIRHIADVYLTRDTPIEEFSIYHPMVYKLRSGYGFLIIDNIQRTNRGWSYSYHSPWFDDTIVNTTSSKYRGYYEL